LPSKKGMSPCVNRTAIYQLHPNVWVVLASHSTAVVDAIRLRAMEGHGIISRAELAGAIVPPIGGRTAVRSIGQYVAVVVNALLCIKGNSGCRGEFGFYVEGKL